MTKRNDEWITANEAAVILSAHTDHDVSAAYVRMIARTGKINSRPRNRRENEYYRPHVEAYRVRLQNAQRVRPRPSTRKPMNKETPMRLPAERMEHYSALIEAAKANGDMELVSDLAVQLIAEINRLPGNTMILPAREETVQPESDKRGA